MAASNSVLHSTRAAVERLFPGAFAHLCPVFDRIAVRDPLHEVHLLPLFLAPGEEACDIGANRGLFTYWLLRGGSKVTAFEPNPAMATVLRHRFAAALRRGRFTLVEGALSDRTGSATLHIPKGFSPLATIDGGLAQAGMPMETADVKLFRLDEVVSGDVAFIKVDVEGHEVKVLEGATAILDASRPTILVEAEERHRPDAVASLRTLLEPLGYKGFFRQGGRMAPVAAFDPGTHQAPDALNAAGTHVAEGRTYINNFFFAARPDVIARLEAMTA